MWWVVWSQMRAVVQCQSHTHTSAFAPCGPQAQMASLQRQADIMERQLAKAEKEQAAAQTQEAREANRQAAL